MTAPSPAPAGRVLALILTGIVLTLTTSITAVATGHWQLMIVAAVGFALQLAGWIAHGRRNGGA